VFSEPHPSIVLCFASWLMTAGKELCGWGLITSSWCPPGGRNPSQGCQVSGLVFSRPQVNLGQGALEKCWNLVCTLQKCLWLPLSPGFWNCWVCFSVILRSGESQPSLPLPELLAIAASSVWGCSGKQPLIPLLQVQRLWLWSPLLPLQTHWSSSIPKARNPQSISTPRG
jgi:hypothetical protein